MKLDFRHLLFAYCLTFVFYIIFIFTSISECIAYWMHDASIDITHTWLVLYCCYLFILPTIILLFFKLKKLETPIKLFISQFFISLLSISLLALSINEPCEYINNGYYMFTNTTITLGYYLFKLISFIIIVIIFITLISALRLKRKQILKNND